MADVVKAVGSEVNKGINRLTYTNPIIWGVVPGVITCILILTIIVVLQVPLSGEQTLATPSSRRCEVGGAWSGVDQIDKVRIWATLSNSWQLPTVTSVQTDRRNQHEQ